MAGIGFELKKLFRGRSISSLLKAYGYTGMVTAGPMLLGILLLVGIMLLAGVSGLPDHERELLICMVTYALLASLTATSWMNMVMTRFTADMLYEGREEAVLPSFEGGLSILLVTGGILYGIFLCFAGISFRRIMLNYMLFSELAVVWTEMNYLTAIKDYVGIIKSFLLAVLMAFLSGGLLVWIFGPSLEALLVGVCTGYGVMMCRNLKLLYRFFPRGEGSRFAFLPWFDEYRELAGIGFFTNIGLFSHLVIAWAGTLGVKVQGLFFGAPQHDVPAMFAFLTILVTTVNFVVSVEVNFYPKYRNYYELFNKKGSLKDIEHAEYELLTVLEQELSYTGRKQFYTTALMLSVGLMVLTKLPLGFNDLMEGYFRVLCVGYAIYAVGNTVMLMLLYFTDYEGAYLASAAFAAVTVAGSILSLRLDVRYYGFAFLIGSVAYFFISWLRLKWFTKNLPYHILCAQPILTRAKSGRFTGLKRRLEGRGVRE